MKEPQPMIGDGLWKVRVDFGLGYVRVGPSIGCLCCHSGNHYVTPPNRLERLFGITFDSKIERAVLKCQKYCDRQNALAKIAAEKAKMWRTKVIS